MDTLLGNEALKRRMSAALSKGQLSHSYLISGPVGSGKRTLSSLLAAAAQCVGVGQRPCLRCPQCRKVLSGTHPDVITVDDPEKKTVPVKLVRDACSDLYIRPNEGAKKIYIFPRAQELNAFGQNALLKCMEEPPTYGMFLLLADNAAKLLPTVRSRCVELRLSPLPEDVLCAALRQRFPAADGQALSAAAQRSGGYLGQAIAIMEENAALLPQTVEFAAAYRAADRLALLRVLAPMERLKRDQLRPILQQWYALLASALAAQSGQPPLRPESAQIAASRTAAELLSAVDALRQAIVRLEANTGPAHICGALCILFTAP